MSGRFRVLHVHLPDIFTHNVAVLVHPFRLEWYVQGGSLPTMTPLNLRLIGQVLDGLNGLCTGRFVPVSSQRKIR